MNAAAVLALAAELNFHTKFSAVPMRDHGNEAGADHVLTWLTGYPLGVDLSRGYPRSNPGEFTAVDLLARRDADAAVVIGDGPWAVLPQSALDHLTRIPRVVINSHVGDASRPARVHLTAAATAAGTAGTVYRMDKIPLPVRVALPAPYPSEEELIRRVREAVER
jgi:formylmethanofuran dehydrogenase subunit B